MQLMLFFGIVSAIGAVVFALQNNVSVTVTFAAWQFDGSLALVLLLALGLGVLIAGLLSSPAVIRGQWAAAHLRRQVVDLEGEVAVQQVRNHELVAELERLAPATVIEKSGPEKPYVGLRDLLAGEESVKPSVESQQPVSEKGL